MIIQLSYSKPVNATQLSEEFGAELIPVIEAGRIVACHAPDGSDPQAVAAALEAHVAIPLPPKVRVDRLAAIEAEILALKAKQIELEAKVK